MGVLVRQQSWRLSAVQVALVLCGGLSVLYTTGALGVGAQAGSVPGRPTGLVAVAAHDSVTLFWDDPRDASIIHYQVFRRDRDVHGVGEFIMIESDTGSPATTYTDKTAEEEKSYVYRVKAVNRYGAGKWSTYARADTPAAPTPEPRPPESLAPGRLVVGMVEGRVTLSWEAPVGDTGSVTGYQVLRRRPLEGEATLGVLVSDTSSADTTYVDATAVEAGVRYTYRVKAWRGGDLSGWSNFARLDLPDDYTALEEEAELRAPTNLSAEVVDAGVVLGWDPPAVDAELVSGYVVLRARGGSRLVTLVSDTGNADTTYLDGSATEAGETYGYRVVALRDGEWSEPSNRAEVQIPGADQTPGGLAPTDLAARWVDGRVVLGWDPPLEDAASVIRYEILRVRYSPSGTAQVSSLDTGRAVTAYTDKGATDRSVRYVYRIRAVRSGVRSLWSAKSEVAAGEGGAVPFSGGSRQPFTERREARSGEGSDPPGSGDGPVYTWEDGDRTIRVVLQNDPDVGEDSAAPITGFSVGGDTQDDREPVFRSESGGGLMRLPGGVLLLFEPDVPGADIEAFFARNKISLKLVEAIPGIPHAFLVETEPGFPSLNLANALAAQDEVRVSSPNWEVELETQQEEDEDEHGDTIETATELALDTSVVSEIEDLDDVDFFKIALPAQTDLTVVCVRCLETLTLYDSDGNQLASSEEAITETTRAAGVYYIRVSPSTDEEDSPFYRLFAQTFDHADTIDDASEIELGTTLSPIIYPVGETDVFKFVLTETTEFVIETQGYEDRLLILWDDSGAELVEKGWFAAGTFGAGTYYVTVGGDPASEGSYELRTLVITEQSNSRSSAEALALGETVYGGLTGTDVDWFKIELDEPTEVTVGFELIQEALVPALVVAEVQDSAGNILRGDIRDYRLAAGTSYVRVAPRDGELDFDFFDTLYFGLGLTRNTEYEEFISTCTGIQTTVSDPLYGCQWHLANTDANDGTPGEDAGVGDVWGSYTGEGVRVTVVDYGVDVEHEDLSDNVDTSRSWSADQRSDIYYPGSSHGTSVAGIIAAAGNSLGVRGVAPGATLQSHDLLSGSGLGNILLATVLNVEDTAVVNNSWGYSGSGPVFASSFWESAIEGGIDYGYGGRGVVYVYAGGNGHQWGAQSSLDEFNNFYGVVPVCAVDADGRRAWYSETGANLWVCGPAAGVTAANAGRYRDDFGGTSSSAPVVSGVVALMREANPELTWRDVKLILAASARKNHPDHSGWESGTPKYRSGSDTDRYWFNHEYGFGVVGAAEAVELATEWVNVPPLRTASASSPDALITIPNPESGTEPTTVTSSIALDTDIEFIEFVQIDGHFGHSSFRTLDIELVSPSGAVSTLAYIDDNASRSRFYGEFRFGSARHLGEGPPGTWTLRVTDRFPGSAPSGLLRGWSITVYGHAAPPGAPTVESATPGPGSIAVAWAAPTDAGGTAVTGYDLRHIPTDAADKDDGSWTLVTDVWDAGTLRHRIGGLANGTEYVIEVRAVNIDGPGPWSATLTGTPQATARAPLIGAAIVGDGWLAVRWAAPTDTGSSAVTGYDLRYIPTDAFRKADADWTLVEDAAGAGDTEATVTGLANGVEYDLEVRAVYGGEGGPWSATFWGTPATTPGPPAVTGAAAGDGSLTVEWAAPTSDGGAPVASYDLRYIRSDAPDRSDADWTATATAWTSGPLVSVLTGLTNGADHDISVRAANAAGPGPWSASLTATPGTLPGPPTSLWLRSEDQSLTASWDGPRDSGGLDVASYDVRYIRSTSAAKDDGDWTVIEGVVTSGYAGFDDPEYTIAGLVDGGEYQVQVRAANAAGDGPWSGTRIETAWNPDIRPTLTELAPEGRTFTVRWEAPPDQIGDARLDGYTIFITPLPGYATGGYFRFLYDPATREHVVELRPLIGVEHTVYISAWYMTPTGDGIGTGPSDPLTVTLTAAPGEPSIESVFAGNGSLLVVFGAPGDDGGAVIAGYDARYIRSDAPDRSDANWAEHASVWTSGDWWFKLSGLTNDIGYDLQVRAVNISGAGPWSATSTGTPTSTPGGTPFFVLGDSIDRSIEENSAAGARCRPGRVGLRSRRRHSHLLSLRRRCRLVRDRSHKRPDLGRGGHGTGPRDQVRLRGHRLGARRGERRRRPRHDYRRHRVGIHRDHQRERTGRCGRPCHGSLRSADIDLPAGERLLTGPRNIHGVARRTSRQRKSLQGSPERGDPLHLRPRLHRRRPVHLHRERRSPQGRGHSLITVSSANKAPTFRPPRPAYAK